MIDTIALIVAANLSLVPNSIEKALPILMSWHFDFRESKNTACITTRSGRGVCQSDFDWNVIYKGAAFAINDSIKNISYRVIGDSLYAIPLSFAYDSFGLAKLPYSSHRCFDEAQLGFLCAAPFSIKPKIEYGNYDFFPGKRIRCRASRDTIIKATPINDSLFSANKLLYICRSDTLVKLTRRAGSIVDEKVMLIPDWGAVLSEDINISIQRERNVLGLYHDSLLSQTTLDTYLLQHLYSKGCRRFKLPIRGAYKHSSVTRSVMNGDSVRVYYISQRTGEYTPMVFSVRDGITIQSKAKGVLPKVVNKLNRQSK